MDKSAKIRTDPKTLTTSQGKFPHIQRKISAPSHFSPLKYLIIGCIVLILIINVAYPIISSPDEEKSLQRSILQNPHVSSNHEALGEFYLTRNQIAAEREYTLAEELYKEPLTTSLKIAGMRTSPMETFHNLKRQKTIMQNEITTWEKLHQMLPDYTYAQIKLGILYFQTGDADKSRSFLTTTLKENPTNEIAGKLLEKLEGY